MKKWVDISQLWKWSGISENSEKPRKRLNQEACTFSSNCLYLGCPHAHMQSPQIQPSLVCFPNWLLHPIPPPPSCSYQICEATWITKITWNLESDRPCLHLKPSSCLNLGGSLLILSLSFPICKMGALPAVFMNMSVRLLPTQKGIGLAWNKTLLSTAHSSSNSLQSDPAVAPPLAAAPQRAWKLNWPIFSPAQHKVRSLQGSQEGLLAWLGPFFISMSASRQLSSHRAPAPFITQPWSAVGGALNI